jgi:hypothetical protein
MLMGLLRWGREASGKHAWVIHRVGLSMRGNGSGITTGGSSVWGFPQLRFHPRLLQMKRIVAPHSPTDLPVPVTRIRGDDEGYGTTV